MWSEIWAKLMLGIWVVSLYYIAWVEIENGVGVDASSSSSSSPTDDELQPYRTAFHFQPPKNWINDPNGPMYFNGVYHLFYQYNPYGPLWGNISWGHSISYDLVNWFLLQPALTPKEAYDINGCLSGSTTILPGPKPIILYTGLDLNNSQVQNIAFPKNLSDPLLKDWIKWSGNPFLTPINDILPDKFRDPSTAWMGPDGKWRIVIGGEIDGHGTALLYHSKNGTKWTRSKTPLHFSSKTGMWECPDFYPVVSNGDKKGLDTSFDGNNTMHVLKASFGNREYYVIGTYDPRKDQFFVTGNDFMVSNTQFQYDYGRFYASKSFYDSVKQRRVLWGWVTEGDNQSDYVKRGWAGLQSFPRSIWLSNDRKQLVQWPVDEIQKLHTKQVNITNRKLAGGVLLKIPGITASQADVEVSFSLTNLTEAEVIDSEVVDPYLLCAQKNASVSGSFGPFGLLVFASKNLTEQTAVFFRVFKGPNKFLVLMCSDQSRSSIAQNVDKSIYGAFVNLDPVHEKISLRSLIDHSIVESFGGEGLACIIARVYPKLAINEQAQLYVFNRGMQSVTISTLDARSMKKSQILPIG